MASSVDNRHRFSPSRAWRRGRSCSTRVCTWASSASESRPSSSPSWAEASASAAGFSTDTPEDVENFSGCLQPARRSRGSSARRARRLTMGSPPCWIISAIVPQDGEKEKGGGTLNASRRHRLSINPLSEGFGGKDSVKENRQGCLSRPIKRLLSTFLKCSKVQQLVERTFSTSWGGGTLNASRRHSVSAGPEIPARPGGKPVRAPAGAPAAGRATERTRRPPAYRAEGGDRAPRRPRSG